MSSWQIVHLWETPTIFKIYEGVSAIAVNSLGTLLILLSVWWWSLWWSIFSQSCDDNDDPTWEAKRVARVPKTLSVTKTRLSPTSSGWFEFCKGTKLAKSSNWLIHFSQGGTYSIEDLYEPRIWMLSEPCGSRRHSVRLFVCLLCIPLDVLGYN